MKKFDFVIGNPPYQETRDTTKDMPVYDKFIDSARQVAEKVELITPARFLFNAGATSKQWNLKMLNDEHFKVLFYEPNSSQVFQNTEIKGGVAIHYIDTINKYKPIRIFTKYEKLNGITLKVQALNEPSLNSVMFSPANCRFTDDFLTEQPEAVAKLSKGNERMLATNVFDTLDSIVFFEEMPNNQNNYIKVIGRSKNDRVYRWIKRKYISGKNIDGYKLCLPKVSGTGKLGEALSSPVVLNKCEGHT